MILAFSGVTIKVDFLFLGITNRDNRFVCKFARETSISPVRYSLYSETAACYADLSLQQFRFKNDIVGMDALNVQVVQSIFAVEEAEQLVCGPVVQLLACIRVDM